MLKKDFNFMCELFKIEKEDIKNNENGYFYKDIFMGKDSIELFDNYYLMLFDKINIDELIDVIRNIIYVDCGAYGSRATTKEGYTFIKSITKSQFNNIKNIDKSLLLIDFNKRIDLPFEQRQALKIIYGFLLRHMIKRAEIYFEKEFDKLYC